MRCTKRAISSPLPRTSNAGIVDHSANDLDSVVFDVAR